MISLLLPTLARPGAARRFLDSAAELRSRPELVEVVMYLNDDDPGSHQIRHDQLSVTRIIGPNATMGTYNTACLAQSRGGIVILVNDDVVIRTPGWDEHVRAIDEEFPDGIYLAYGNDLFKGERISTFPILSRTTCDLLVTPYPAAYRGGLIDYHLFDIFKRLQKLGHDRIRYAPGLIFEHLHHRTGKMPYDETYSRRGRFDDDPTFLALRDERQRAAERLAAAIEGGVLPEWRPSPPVPGQPASLFAAVRSFATAFLVDGALPARYRMFLFIWYCGRYLARRGIIKG